MYCKNMCNVIKILFLSLRNPFKTRLNRSFSAGNCLNGRADVSDCAWFEDSAQVVTKEDLERATSHCYAN